MYQFFYGLLSTMNSSPQTCSKESYGLLPSTMQQRILSNGLLPSTMQQRILWTLPLNHAAKNLMDSSPQPCSKESYGLLPSTMQQRILWTPPLNHAAKNLIDSSHQPRRKEPFGVLLALLRFVCTPPKEYTAKTEATSQCRLSYIR
jgi:hypothetical protein